MSAWAAPPLSPTAVQTKTQTQVTPTHVLTTTTTWTVTSTTTHRTTVTTSTKTAVPRHTACDTGVETCVCCEPSTSTMTAITTEKIDHDEEDDLVDAEDQPAMADPTEPYPSRSRSPTRSRQRRQA